MTRKDPRANRRAPETPPPTKKGGLATGLVIGLVIGIVLSAGMAWYFNMGTSGFKQVDSVPPVDRPVVAAEPKKQPATSQPPAPESPPPDTTVTADKPRQTRPASPAETPTPTVKPRVDYTFYGILPGEKPARPVEPPVSTSETWWLQVAALKSPADANNLKARLKKLGLPASTQKIESGGQSLYRVRVGPYKREDDALGDLDTLGQNDFEPRLLKEPVKPKE